MGRRPCCRKEGVNKGAWIAVEDEILTNYIKAHGEGNWRSLPKKAGLNRCGKSCRLRWVNYLRPDIKRGNISSDEEDLIIRLHKLLGNKWSLIAGRLPGRTDNEIKNYWNTNLGKKAHHHRQLSFTRRIGRDRTGKTGTEGTHLITATQPPTVTNSVKVVHTKAVKCSKVFIHQEEAHNRGPVAVMTSEGYKPPNDKLNEPSLLEDQDFIVDIDTEDNSLSNFTILDEALERWDNTLFGNQCFLDKNLMFSDRNLQDLSAVNDRGQPLPASAFNPLTPLLDHGGDWMQ